MYYNGRHYIGGVEELQQWAADVYHFVRRPNRLVHMRGAGKELQQHMEATGHDFAFMDVAVGQGVPERVLFELFTDTCPKTCANFLALCTGERGQSESGTKLHYKGNIFHRVVPKAWVQAGGASPPPLPHPSSSPSLLSRPSPPRAGWGSGSLSPSHRPSSLPQTL